ncbi:MAG: hypothetical protein ACUVS4_05875 [Chloroflexaceae bacterium]
MRIHISWTALLAMVIFLIALGLMLRFASQLWTSEAQTLMTISPTPTQHTAPTIAAEATPQTTVQPVPTPTATVTPVPSPQPTLPPPSPTPFQPPTREPTPIPDPLTVVAQGFGQRAGSASYAFVISNPNPDLLAQNVRYQVAAYNAEGIVLLTDTDTIAQIGPGQRMGVARQVTLPTNLMIARIEILIRPGQFVQAPPLQELPVSNVAFIQSDPPIITGILSNPLNRDLANIKVIGIAYDDDGIIGGGAVEVPFAAAQGQAPISIPVNTSQLATRVEFFAQVSTAP